MRLTTRRRAKVGGFRESGNPAKVGGPPLRRSS